MGSRRFEVFTGLSQTGQDIRKALWWGCAHFDSVVFLNSNQYDPGKHGSHSWVMALGSASCIEGGEAGAFASLKDFLGDIQDWSFGMFSYELKNQLEALKSRHANPLDLPSLHFFQPIVLILPSSQGWEIGCLPGFGQYSDHGRILQDILDYPVPTDEKIQEISLQQRVSKGKYLETVRKIKEHIQAGDIYEMNYCVEFFAREAEVDPLSVYFALNEASPTPFSCFYQHKGQSLMCASPERFLRKKGEVLVSQPIKGTIARGKTPAEDEMLRQKLLDDPKERSENVMIVDLVRNDLSRSAQKNSVRVEELFGIYPFRQVYQMISTISARLNARVSVVDAIARAFPMGSMTGAPKVRAMQLIDQYEDSCRGLYSGAVGYFSPEGDFDFNVVIRSIVYNARTKYLGFMAGSAITNGSEPESEYEECLLKATAMKNAISGRFKDKPRNQ